MTYPTLPPDAVIRFIQIVAESDDLLSHEQVMEFVDEFKVNAEPYECDLGALELCANDLNADLLSRQSASAPELEVLEGKICGAVHAAIDQLPIEILDDPEFWSYLSIRYFWRFVLMREHKSMTKLRGIAARPAADRTEDEESADTPLRRYFDGNDPYQIPLRLYVRAQAIRNGDDYSLGSAVKSGTDFWRSHVVRVSTSYYPPLSRALAQAQAERPLSTTSLRATARRINRYRANMHPVIMGDSDQAAVVDQFWPEGGTSA
jgi:hypothetical protein